MRITDLRLVRRESSPFYRKGALYRKTCQFFNNFHGAKLVLGCSKFHEESKNTSGCQRYGQKRSKNGCFPHGSRSPCISAPARFSLAAAETPGAGVSIAGEEAGAAFANGRSREEPRRAWFKREKEEKGKEEREGGQQCYVA